MSSPPPAEIFWVGDGPIGDSDGWAALVRRRSEPHLARGEPSSIAAKRILAALSDRGASFFDALLPSEPTVADRSQYVDALWELCGAGLRDR